MDFEYLHLMKHLFRLTVSQNHQPMRLALRRQLCQLQLPTDGYKSKTDGVRERRLKERYHLLTLQAVSEILLARVCCKKCADKCFMCLMSYPFSF